MRPIEWITIILLLPAWGSLIIPAKKFSRTPAGLAMLPLLAAFVQLILEHYRWSMVPAYFLAVLFFILGVSRNCADKSGSSASLTTRNI